MTAQQQGQPALAAGQGADRCAQVSDVAGGQEVVDVDQEALIDDLVIGQNEDNLQRRAEVPSFPSCLI